MASAKNEVVSGDYKGKGVLCVNDEVYISLGLFKKSVDITKDTVEHYEVLDEQTSKSGASAIGRAAVGSLLLGPVGLLAGVTAKTKGAYYIAIQFKDGKKSLIEVNDKIYKIIMTTLF